MQRTLAQWLSLRPENLVKHGIGHILQCVRDAREDILELAAENELLRASRDKFEWKYQEIEAKYQALLLVRYEEDFRRED